MKIGFSGRPFGPSDRFRVRQKVVPLPVRVSLIGGTCVITENTDLQAIANYGCLYHRLTRLLAPAR